MSENDENLENQQQNEQEDKEQNEQQNEQQEEKNDENEEEQQNEQQNEQKDEQENEKQQEENDEQKNKNQNKNDVKKEENKEENKEQNENQKVENQPPPPPPRENKSPQNNSENDNDTNSVLSDGSKRSALDEEPREVIPSMMLRQGKRITHLNDWVEFFKKYHISQEYHVDYANFLVDNEVWDLTILNAKIEENPNYLIMDCKFMPTETTRIQEGIHKEIEEAEKREYEEERKSPKKKKKRKSIVQTLRKSITKVFGKKAERRISLSDPFPPTFDKSNENNSNDSS